LAELADALDSKSSAANQNPSVKSGEIDEQSKTLSPGLSLNSKNQPEIDRNLQSVIDAWPALPADVRRSIAAVVRATLKAGKRRK